MSTADVIELRRSVKEQLRQRVLEAIQAVLDEEVAAALGVERHERGKQRQGYRHGATQRVVTTATGRQTLTVPRARVRDGQGGTREFQSELLPRYQRRTREVDEAILNVYLAGANSRRIKRALEPLLGDTHLSKSAISRVVARLKALFAQWRDRDLSSETYAIVFLDGFHLKVRLAKRVVAVPVLVALGVAEDGSKRLIALELAVSESSAAWGGFVAGLLDRGLQLPRLLVTDGHGGLKKARGAWPAVAVQRCTQHKWENLKRHCPTHAHAELRRDWSAIVQAQDGAAARRAYDAMLTKWRTLCPPVVRSLDEAGLELLTFYAFPKPMWKGLRTTNSIENLNREFRRRTKTQGSFASEDAALTLLFGLVAFRQIELRKITGYSHVAALLADHALTGEAA
jgi:transposase-like protein